MTNHIAEVTIKIYDRPTPEKPHHVEVIIESDPEMPLTIGGLPDVDEATDAQAFGFAIMAFIEEHAPEMQRQIIDIDDVRQLPETEEEVDEIPPTAWQDHETLRLKREDVTERVLERLPANTEVRLQRMISEMRYDVLLVPAELPGYDWHEEDLVELAKALDFTGTFLRTRPKAPDA